MRIDSYLQNLPLAAARAAQALTMCIALPAASAMAADDAAQPAAPTASAPMSKGELKAIREFNMLDFNGDGKLSRNEVAIVPRLAAAFDEADTNHDGFVTLDEVRAFTIKYRAERDRAKAAAAAAAAAAAGGQPPQDQAQPQAPAQPSSAEAAGTPKGKE